MHFPTFSFIKTLKLIMVAIIIVLCYYSSKSLNNFPWTSQNPDIITMLQISYIIDEYAIFGGLRLSLFQMKLTLPFYNREFEIKFYKFKDIYNIMSLKFLNNVIPLHFYIKIERI